jgi:hypothetical protein
MKVNSVITLILGLVLAAFGIYLIIGKINAGGIIPLIVGGSLIYLGWRGGRTGVIIFGHACIIVGCMLITLGIYLLPYSQPTILHVFTRPLFWGLFSVFGGICANYHGFCSCIRRKD